MEASEVDSSPLQSVETSPGEMQVTYSKRKYSKEETMPNVLSIWLFTLPTLPPTDAEKHWKDVLQGNLLVEHQPKSCTVRLFVSSDPQGIRVL